MLAKVSRKGQVTLPAEVRRHLHIGYGTYVRFIVEDGNVRLVPSEKGIESLKGSVKVSGEQNFKSARHQAMEETVHERTASNRR
ncbi:AbrB family transcriptional regulator [Clostridiales bacterium PH28_bin88]|nr:AbrB family transcriptional regulator [Clostridiales bacterium PH28_bin88]